MEERLESLRGRVLGLLTEDAYTRRYFQQQVDDLVREGGERFYARLLEVFVHLEFEEAEAVGHWEMILGGYDSMREALGRSVGLRVAMLDYFLNLNRLLNNPMLVEIHIFRQQEQLALTDGLTDLFNRRYFDIALEKELRRAGRHGKPVSLLLLDLDDFKRCNDANGHLFGDLVLKRFAHVVQAAARAEDTPCRFGGEEFAVLLPEVSAAGAALYAERLRGALAADAFFRENGITASGGLASYPRNGRTPETLVAAADRALYRAKTEGKDRILEAWSEKRRHRRVSTRFRLGFRALERPERPALSELYTDDVSLGGVRFAAPVRLAPDTEILLYLSLTNNGKAPVQIPGKVAWAVPDGRDYAYGVEFHGMTDETREQLLVAIPRE